MKKERTFIWAALGLFLASCGSSSSPSNLSLFRKTFETGEHFRSVLLSETSPTSVYLTAVCILNRSSEPLLIRLTDFVLDDPYSTAMTSSFFVLQEGALSEGDSASASYIKEKSDSLFVYPSQVEMTTVLCAFPLDGLKAPLYYQGNLVSWLEPNVSSYS